MKRSSVYRQLLVNITLTLFVGLVVLSFINYKVNESTLEETNAWQRKIIFKQVKDIMDIYDHGMAMFEKNFDSRMKNISRQILTAYRGKTDELEKADLDSLCIAFDIDTLTEDLYVINRNYTIVNTTFLTDLGLNFFKRNAEAKVFFDTIFAHSYCVVDRFTTERATGNYKKYSYQPSFDGQIILEMGFFSDKANHYKAKMEKNVKDIKNLFPEVKQVDLFQAQKGSLHFSIKPEVKDVFLAVMDDKKPRRKEIKTEEGTQYVDLMFLPIQNSTMYEGYVIQIVSDDSQRRKLVYNEVKKSIIMFVATLVPLLLIIGYRAKKITGPIKKLSDKSKLISSGKLDERIEVVGNNEITELSVNFNNMIEQLQESYETLESKVVARTAEVVEQKHIIEEKHKEITDSINYAERIQRSFLATTAMLDENLPEYFVFFQPKDVVSGDFYWAAETFENLTDLNNSNDQVLKSSNDQMIKSSNDQTFYLACADSTGHGVPGAIMSLLNITSLENALKEGMEQPMDILNHTRKTIIERLKKDGSAEGGKDGMDCSLISLHLKSNRLRFALANNPLWLIRNGELSEYAPDKMPVGKHDKDTVSFTQQEIHLQKGDLIYIFTDGYPDQFGGPKGKKFKYKNLGDLLLMHHQKNMQAQKEILATEFHQWKGDLEQVDDVCIIGIRI